jgi:hypothetical protein
VDGAIAITFGAGVSGAGTSGAAVAAFVFGTAPPFTTSGAAADLAEAADLLVVGTEVEVFAVVLDSVGVLSSAASLSDDVVAGCEFTSAGCVTG